MIYYILELFFCFCACESQNRKPQISFKKKKDIGVLQGGNWGHNYSWNNLSLVVSHQSHQIFALIFISASHEFYRRIRGYSTNVIFNQNCSQLYRMMKVSPTTPNSPEDRGWGFFRFFFPPFCIKYSEAVYHHNMLDRMLKTLHFHKGTASALARHIFIFHSFLVGPTSSDLLSLVIRGERAAYQTSSLLWRTNADDPLLAVIKR